MEPFKKKLMDAQVHLQKVNSILKKNVQTVRHFLGISENSLFKGASSLTLKLD